MDDMRQRGEWMNPVDDPILEYLRSHDFGTPENIASETGNSPGYITQRLSTLMDYGLASRAARGVYVLTDEGAAYLDEELDASELEPGYETDSGGEE